MLPLRSMVYTTGILSIGALSIQAIKYLEHWTDQNSKELPENEKDFIALRMELVARAFFKSKQFDRNTRKAKKHVRLVASLSSYDAILKKMENNYPNSQSLSSYAILPCLRSSLKNSSSKTFVFKYGLVTPISDNPKNDYLLFSKPLNTRKAFLFTGFSSNLHDTESYNDILSGDYIRCKIEYVTTPKADEISKFVSLDAVITGTTDCSNCNTLKDLIVDNKFAQK